METIFLLNIFSQTHFNDTIFMHDLIEYDIIIPYLIYFITYHTFYVNNQKHLVTCSQKIVNFRVNCLNIKNGIKGNTCIFCTYI